MKKAGGSYAPAAGYLAQRMAQMPELNSPEMPSYTLNEYEPLLDSANIGPANWGEIGQDILEQFENYDGFVIIHGTDTMAYSASALSFMLENLTKPVIFTGSQIPLAEVRSDARENLITSMLLAANYPIPEVCLYLNGKLLRGNRSRKVSSSGFEAFDSPNFPALGVVGVDIKPNWDLICPLPTAALRLQKLSKVRVAALRIFPGITASIVRNFLQEPVQGLVLESYGAGNAPTNDPAFLRALGEAAKRGVVIVNFSQCLRGSVDMDEYAPGSALKDAGVISGADMTPEAALGKLFYLFSQDKSIAEIKEKIQRNLRGELSP